MERYLNCGCIYCVYGGSKGSKCPECNSSNIDTSKEYRRYFMKAVIDINYLDQLNIEYR